METPAQCSSSEPNLTWVKLFFLHKTWEPQTLIITKHGTRDLGSKDESQSTTDNATHNKSRPEATTLAGCPAS